MASELAVPTVTRICSTRLVGMETEPRSTPMGTQVVLPPLQLPWRVTVAHKTVLQSDTLWLLPHPGFSA
jgi:hypothetical protein